MAEEINSKHDTNEVFFGDFNDSQWESSYLSIPFFEIVFNNLLIDDFFINIIYCEWRN